ncbi:unnamed protein product [Rhodiola kirilowii]
MSKPALRICIILFVALLFTAEVQMAEAGLCERRSKTWTGFCGSSNSCDRQCRSWEKAKHGACHAQFPGFACFCYFNC